MKAQPLTAEDDARWDGLATGADHQPIPARAWAELKSATGW